MTENRQEWGYPGGWALMSMLVLIMVIVSQACTYYRTCQIVEYKYIYRHYFNYIKKKRKQSKKIRIMIPNLFSTRTHSLIGDN